ncbi:hypothetical protein [Yersinia aldovae]|uniref:hypothetical protein n=1 Tax=Yersinia aldovae TaxID=29483 RepID=UPI000A5DF750|nr:hypothetical protein [Yersinia aldovae]
MDAREKCAGQGCPSRWFVSPKGAGGLPAGQYFAQALDSTRVRTLWRLKLRR